MRTPGGQEESVGQGVGEGRCGTKCCEKQLNGGKMLQNEKKLANIIEELTRFFFSIGAKDICTKVHVEDHCAEIEITSDYQQKYNDKLESLMKYFNEPKNEALEDFYWELTGTGDPGESSQLLMVGMMIDKADVEIGEDQVRVKLYKEIE